MKKKYFSISVLLMGINIFSQQWKSLVTEDFGNQTTQDTRSQTPAADLNTGVTDCIPAYDTNKHLFCTYNGANWPFWRAIVK